MACFLVPAAEAAITEVVKRVEESKETEHHHEDADTAKVSLSTKLSWLTKMLWGGAFLLMFEHVWHGEVVPWFPFLTAMGNAEDTAEMLHEMSTVGVTMAVIITVVWVGMVLVSNRMEKENRAAEKVNA
ncbi:MAG: hypothetical protein IIZ48_02945 [Erysipelotrichales bacterium]|nr:hypothetical protein [Erysipelotrichales bacterium]